MSALTAWLSPIATMLVFTLGALGVWLNKRRIARHEARESAGGIESSKADSLWVQSQTMLASSQEARFKAEAQRDRLIDAQTAQVIPMLTAMNTTLVGIAVLLKEGDGNGKQPGHRQADSRSDQGDPAGH